MKMDREAQDVVGCARDARRLRLVVPADNSGLQDSASHFPSHCSQVSLVFVSWISF